jgi:hypothetical protein
MIYDRGWGKQGDGNVHGTLWKRCSWVIAGWHLESPKGFGPLLLVSDSKRIV